MYDLGAMYENGEGVVKDQQQAVERYGTALRWESSTLNCSDGWV